MRVRSISHAVLFVLLSDALSGQAVRPFEVASIRLHEGPGRIGISTSGPRLTASAKTVASLIMYAYDVKSYQIPYTPPLTALGDMFYDVAAKAESEATPTADEFRQMVQLLLAERFHLKIHREPREIAVYALVAGRSAPKFKESGPDAEAAEHYSANGRNWEVTMPKATMADVIRAIENSLVDRPVLDRTGLTGTYNIRMTFTPDIPPNRKNPDPDDLSIFTAVREQLGLRLEPQKAMMEMFVVDHVDKPTGN